MKTRFSTICTIFKRKRYHSEIYRILCFLDGTGIWTHDLVFSKKEMIRLINTKVKKLVPLFNDNSDPARLYSFDDGIGIVGFIPSITEPFCQYCDRIRITSDGKFYTCLFEKKDIT